MLFSFFNKNKKITVELRKEQGLFRGLGLIFRTINTKNVLFEFDKPSRVAITSVFVFFPFIAVWLNNKKKIIEVQKINPFVMSIKPKKNSKYLVELPLNAKNKKIIKLLSRR